MNNPPAFPQGSQILVPGADGMTLRDYFAAKAMQGWISTYPDDSAFPENKEKLARECYEMADAMLKAREQ